MDGGKAAVTDQVGDDPAKQVRRVWLGRPDLHDRFGDPAKDDAEGFELWCLLHGRRDYPILHHPAIADRLARSMAREVAAWPNLPLPLTATMDAIWQERADVRGSFSLDEEVGRTSFIHWFLTHGLREYRLKSLLPETIRQRLISPDPRSIAPGLAPIPRLAWHAWKVREDLKEIFDLGEARGRAGLLDWFGRSGLWEGGWHDLLPAAQRVLLDEPQPGITHVFGRPITRRMHALWSARPDLQETFDLGTATGRHAYLGWFLFLDPDGDLATRANEVERHWLTEPVKLGGGETVPRWTFVIWQCQPDVQARYDVRRAEGARALQEYLAHADIVTPDMRLMLMKPPGSAPARGPAGRARVSVCVIGSAYGEHGIGEDVRTIARALAAAGVTVAIRDTGNAPMGSGDQSAAALVDPSAEGDAAILVMTPQDAIQAAVQGRLDALRERPIVGALPCELREWPAWAGDALDVVDELWASTRFSAEAFRCAHCVPVHHLPLAVTLPPVDHRPRADFGLPDGRFLFGYVFDVHSNWHRKNPRAVVQAFRQAFPLGTEPVGLVLKVSNASDDDPNWCAMRDLCRSDRRIRVLRQRLDRSAILSLLANCDAYVSLHRSEGFGRPIAEAMALGKPVVVTAYSGNLDFTLSDNACLVDYRPTTIEPGQFAYGAGQSWAEPDIEHASWWMRRLLADRELRLRLATTGRQHITIHHSVEAVGRGYRRRLQELGVLRH